METAALIVSLLAVLVAGGAAWYTRGQKLAADRAVEEAARSADASERSADTAESGLELQRVAERRAEEAAERTGVTWELLRTGNSTYTLYNRGTHAAYDVRVDLADLGGIGAGVESFDEFPADHAEQYMLSRGIASTTTSIVVRWHQRQDRADTPKRQSLPVDF
ncbi:hypothetical protein [Actinophytocola algeriensis]|uniref:Uncharacterized protein n=1 Tax=Actinophytocola algeriensis TaxID=1768010 RepID=A0A7W7VHL8_9PSEU|nr:hypothetical protein [Actinophytocola algeriensis]MBB4910561.1 hypothetical protein [Actinophytocola algeriensis]MBE1480450.1 hypothetical protein [Actinophytocola algeriensis]